MGVMESQGRPQCAESDGGTVPGLQVEFDGLGQGTNLAASEGQLLRDRPPIQLVGLDLRRKCPLPQLLTRFRVGARQSQNGVKLLPPVGQNFMGRSGDHKGKAKLLSPLPPLMQPRGFHL